MLRRLCLPVKPFYPDYLKVWFTQLDTTLALNDVTAEPTIHAILLDALPVELRNLAAVSSSGPQPYNDVCSAVLCCYGLTYHLFMGTRAGLPRVAVSSTNWLTALP